MAKKRQRKELSEDDEEETDNEWIDVTEEDVWHPKRINDFDGTVVLPSDFDADTSPIKYFELFFDEELIELIVDETNKYARTKSRPVKKYSRMQHWSDCTREDIKALLGVVINMGLNPRPDITDYYSQDWTQKMSFFSDVFPRDKFLLLFWNLHFAMSDAKVKDSRIRPVIDKINMKSKVHYLPSSRVAVDESTILFKGRFGSIVYNPQKPVKSGVKAYVLADSSNGYIFSFKLYLGKTSSSDSVSLLKTTKVVKELCQTINDRKLQPSLWHHVYTDRYYTSPELANELKSMNFLLTGTVMTNRKGLPIEFSKKKANQQAPKATKKKNATVRTNRLQTSNKTKVQKMKKGEIRGYRNRELMALQWMDKRVVTMLSTGHKGSNREVTLIPCKNPALPPKSKPDVIVDYTKHMGAVDRADHFISSYQFMRRSKKWYRKIFFWLLEVSIVNSYLLHSAVQRKADRKQFTHKKFRKQLIEKLVEPKIMKENLSQSHRTDPTLPKGMHFMERAKKGKRCVSCYKKGLRRETIYFCSSCANKPFLHPDKCFEMFHTDDWDVTGKD